jgi:hypothetical protein
MWSEEKASPCPRACFTAFLDRTAAGAPTDEENLAFRCTKDFRHGKFGGERAQFVAALVGHEGVELRRASGVTHLVVLEPGDDRVLAARDECARCNVTRDAALCLQVVRLVIGDGCEVGRDVLANLFKVWIRESLDAAGDPWSVRRMTGVEYLRAIFTASIAV